jgi:hypothetical protein
MTTTRRLAAAGLLLLAVAGCARPTTTSASSPAPDPGVVACRGVADRVDRVAKGGPPASDAERAQARAQLHQSTNPELREVADQLDAADRSGSLVKQAEASGALVAVCAGVLAEAGRS